MLEEKLQEVLMQLREAERDFKEKYRIVREWFQGHTENLAERVEDLTFLCELPSEERMLLTYPVIGNWVLKQMEQFQPQTEYQRKVYDLMRKVVSEGRFKNPHMESAYANPVNFTRMEDELLSTMLSNPEESMALHKFISQIGDVVSEMVYSGKLPRKETYTTDLGHGLVAHVQHLTYYVAAPLERLVRRGGTKPLHLTIMVVDDENPDEWYQRLLSVGFQEIKGQQGAFYDAETALKALEQGRYDVILNDYRTW